MDVRNFEINGLLLLTPKVYLDSRGFFTERFKLKEINSLLPGENFIQDNFSRSSYGVLRGLHFQNYPQQGKLVTCLSGRIFDVAVDLRKDSSTYGKHVSIVLDGDKPQWLWIPTGFAHGFCVMSSSGADVLYKVNAPYNPDAEGGILWSDPGLAIQWPILAPILSGKDASLPILP